MTRDASAEGIEIHESGDILSFDAHVKDVMARRASAIIWYGGVGQKYQKKGWACYVCGAYLKLVKDKSAALELVRVAMAGGE